MSVTGTAPDRARQLFASLVMPALFAVQAVAALLPHLPLLFAASVLGLGTDMYRHGLLVGPSASPEKVTVEVTTRQFMRDILMLVGLLRAEILDLLPGQALLLIALLLFYGTHFVCQAVAVLVRRTRALPFVTRNIDASALRLSDAPPRILSRETGRRLLRFAVPSTVGMMLTAITTDAYWGGIG
ncbi:hypothetical protein ACIRDV_29535, partial [Streptomyces sp. NPDC093589]